VPHFLIRSAFGRLAPVRVAVIGHVEWVDFMRVEHMPEAGEIIHAEATWEQAGGGGGVAAVQLAKLTADCTLYTAFGDDDRGRRARDELLGRGVRVTSVVRPEPHRRAVTHIDPAGERTITVLGHRLVPMAADPLPWEELERTDGVYLTGGDAAAVRLARRARVLVATTRVLPLLAEAGVLLDGVVGSASDVSEAYTDGDLDPRPSLVVMTEGARGGTFAVGGDEPQRFEPAPLDGPIVDTYGAGDSFAAGLTYALASGRRQSEAVAFAARCGAAVLAGAGPFASQLKA
jgi:ribokinase